MAKYTITHTCGHEEIVNLVGPYVQRDRTRERMAEQPCYDCRNAERAQRNAEVGLPALSGSERQIAWAESIRASLLATVESELTYARSAQPTRVPTLEAQRAGLAAQTRAAWFIDHRYSR